MNEIVSTILALIHSGLTGKVTTLPEQVEWQKVLTMGKRHKVVPLLYYGIVNSGLDCPIKEEFFEQTALAAMIDHKQMVALEELKQLFKEHKIDHIPLKGAVIKKHYPKPELCSMGDIDILVKAGQYTQIEPLMKNLGYVYLQESDHECIWQKKPALTVELHKFLMPSYHQDFHRYFGGGWQLATPISSGAHTYAFSDENVFLYAFAHLTKHYRSGGIGLRHFIDIWVLLHTDAPLKEEVVNRALEQLGLTQFYRHVRRTLSVWLEGEAPDDITDRITEWVVSGGSYGTKERNYLGDATREAAMAKSHNQAKRRYFLRAVFPPLKVMRERYTLLKKLPLLLPLCWAVRWGGALFFRRKNITEQKKYMQQFDGEKLKRYREEMCAVGLAYELPVPLP